MAAAFLLAVIAAGSPAYAQIVAPAGRTLFNEGLLIRTLVRLDTFEESQGGGALRRLGSTCALLWGARPHLSLSLVTPFVRATQGGASRTGSADASVFARYDVLRRSVPGGYTRLAPELGIKLPTGGAFGMGGTDVIGGLVFSHVRDPDWWIADVQLTLPGPGDGGVRAGDRVRFDLAYLRRVQPQDGMGVPMTLVVFELSGVSVEETMRRGTGVRNTGGDLLTFAPGVEYILGRRLVLEASVPIPIYERLKGKQPSPELSVIVGMRWLF
jgi:hypothetical protein